MDPEKEPRRQLTFREMVSSIGSAAFGVQSERNRARDFRHGSAARYVVAGVIATILFVLMGYGVVRLILGLAV